MTKVSEQRMKLRIEYSRETDLIFSDNIPAYADWLEKKLALSQLPVIKSVCDHSWMNTGMMVQGKSLMVCTKCKETKQTVC